MNAQNLIDFLNEVGLDPKSFAYLINVTQRAVNMWCAGEREISGPAIAYINLLRSLPRAVQIQEFSRLNTKENIMYDGMYLVQYSGRDGDGAATLVFINGLIFGHDTGLQYDGIYEPCSEDPNFMNIRLLLTVPKGVALIQGVPAQPAEYNFEITDRIPARTETPMIIKTPYGPVSIVLSFLRPLPNAIAA